MDDSAVSTVQGAKKFEQIGGDAADKLLDGIISGSEMAKARSAFIIVDLHVGVGNVFDGFLLRKRSSTVPVFYFAAGEDSTTLEWLRKTKCDEIAELFGDEKIVVLGHVKAAKERPPDKSKQPPLDKCPPWPPLGPGCPSRIRRPLCWSQLRLSQP